MWVNAKCGIIINKKNILKSKIHGRVRRLLKNTNKR